MLMVVLLALRGAGVADSGAEFERFAEDLFVRPRAPGRELARRLTDVAAVEARANALAHVHRLGGAGVGAAEAHARAIHEVVSRIPERFGSDHYPLMTMVPLAD